MDWVLLLAKLILAMVSFSTIWWRLLCPGARPGSRGGKGRPGREGSAGGIIEWREDIPGNPGKGGREDNPLEIEF